MGAGDLAPDATDGPVVALGLGLVDVGDALPGVPGHVLLGVHPLDLQQRRALVLVRLGPAPPRNQVRNLATTARIEETVERLDGWSPLEAQYGSPHVEPDALALASLHHCRRRRSPKRVVVVVVVMGRGRR